MTSTPDSTEMFLRFSRRSMFAMLVVVAVLGATAIALVLSPAGAVSRSVGRIGWMIPIAIVILVTATQGTLRGRRWSPDSPEVKLVMEDEFRRTNMLRAARIALIVVLVAEWPLALLFGFLTQLPTPRAAMVMAAATVTLGLLTQITLFLFFDRD
ncbi:MAG TPA: hypothetical protein VMU84_17100 [Thermoanaerobaculia bacterium]|nr:hypothetical protein [Thermoanaerobaculia bacterium]